MTPGGGKGNKDDGVGIKGINIIIGDEVHSYIVAKGGQEKGDDSAKGD